MSLTRIEKSAALAALLRQDYAAFGRLIEDTGNINQAVKIDALSQALQLAAPGARIEYSDAAKAIINELVEIVVGDSEHKVGLALQKNA